MSRGDNVKGALYRSVKASELAQPLKVTNTGEGALQAVVSVSGAPTTPEPAAESGFKIERLYYTLDGEDGRSDQGQAEPALRRGAEDHRARSRSSAACWSPIICRRASRSTTRGSSRRARPARCRGSRTPRSRRYSEFRDERFSAAFERRPKDPPVFTVAYVVRAVSPGRYVLPQAYVEDMYRPDRFGRTGTGTIEIAPK